MAGFEGTHRQLLGATVPTTPTVPPTVAITTYSYHSVGCLVGERVTCTYDAEGRLVMIEELSVDENDQPVDRTTVYTYDCSGNG